MEKGVTAFGEYKASDRVDGAELLQKDNARRRREERELMKAMQDEEGEEGESEDDEEGVEVNSDDEGEEDEGEEDEEEEDDDLPDLDALKKLKVAELKEILTARGLSTAGLKADLIQRLDESRLAAKEESEEEDEVEDEDEEDEEEGEEEEEEEGEFGDESESEELEDGIEMDSDSDDGRIRDPITGRKRQRLTPALTIEQKKEIAAAAVAEAAAAGAPAPKVRKNGVLSLSELRRRAKAAAKAKRLAEQDEDEEDDDSDEDVGAIEQERILTPEDFKRIKALKAANALSGAMVKSGAKKANETAAEEMRALMRRADKSAVADRRVNPEALAAVGVKRAHDKESRVASILAGREGRGEFGSSQSRKNKKTGGTNNKEKAKRKNLPLAARVHNAKKRLNSAVSKRVKDKQFKGRFRK